MYQKITANGEDVEIREETRDGDRYLVAVDVPLVKPMELDTGYVPEESVAASVETQNTHGATGWSGTTPTVNHPRNEPSFSWFDASRPKGELVLAANKEVQETLGVGAVEEDYWDGEFVRVNIAVNADRAEQMGGEAADIVANMESGDGLEVSSQYLHAELPPGEYDGAHRDDPKAIAAPDSVALIPNGRGVCSIEDGCGIAPGVAANVADFADDPSNRMGEAQAQTQMPDKSKVEGVRELLSGVMSLLPSDAEPDTEPAANETTKKRRLLQIAKNQETFPTPFPFSGVSECTEQMEGEIDNPGGFCAEWVREVKGEEPGAVGNEEQASDESGGNPGNESEQSTNMDIDREELIDDIASNSEIKPESLEGMGDTCLQTTHESIVGNDDGEGGEEQDEEQDGDGDGNGGGDGTEGETGTDETDTGAKTLGEMTPDEAAEALREQGFVTEDNLDQQVEAAANSLEKKERAERIVANSDEYDEEDVEWLTEVPEKELERKERSASLTGGAPATGSPDFGVGANEDVDTEDMPELEVN